MGEILLKVHESYRWVVAICDKELFGRKLLEGERTLDLSGEFFNGVEMNDEEVASEIFRCNCEDATFNFVGEKSIEIAKKLGVVRDEGVFWIEGVPVALVLL